MINSIGPSLLVVLAILLTNVWGTPPQQHKKRYVLLQGTVSSSVEHGSGWIDLDSLGSFKEGTTMRIKVGGDAKKIIIRILQSGQSPDVAVGIMGQFQVPPERIVTVVLKKSYSNVRQISVHGASKPFGISLGKTNGNATLVSLEYSVP